MREIKYRAWNSKKKEWADEWPFYIIGETTMFDLLKQFSIEDYDSLVIQEFTGLKDSNGKDIYEGDILKVNWYCDAQYVECVWEAARGTWAFRTDRQDEPVMAWHFFGPDSFKTTTEVAGNIHENADLLKEYKDEK